MNALPRSISPSRLLVIAVVASIAMAYVIAPLLPVSFGWENHLIENLQFTVLLIGGVMALVHYTHTPIDERPRMHGWSSLRYGSSWLHVS